MPIIKPTLTLLLLQYSIAFVSSTKSSAQISTYARDSILPYAHVLPTLYANKDNYTLQNGHLQRVPLEINPNAFVINLRGNIIISEKVQGNLSKLWFARQFPAFGLHQGYKTIKDSTAGDNKLAYFALQERKGKKRDNKISELYYFLEMDGDSVLGIAMNGNVNNASQMLRELATFLASNKIPDSILSNIRDVQLIPLAGHQIPIDPRTCIWRGPGNIQCSGYGQMSWSLHPHETEAAAAMNEQFDLNTSLARVELKNESQVPILFEGTEAIAHKYDLKFKGPVGWITKLEGSNTLTVYDVVAPVRGRWIRCMMSYWQNNVPIDDLPPLLESVMKLK